VEFYSFPYIGKQILVNYWQHPDINRNSLPERLFLHRLKFAPHLYTFAPKATEQIGAFSFQIIVRNENQSPAGVNFFINVMDSSGEKFKRKHPTSESFAETPDICLRTPRGDCRFLTLKTKSCCIYASESLRGITAMNQD
jgi:hypothetical protein